MYERGNLYFHLICPLIAMVEFLFLQAPEREGKKAFPFAHSFLGMIPTALYGKTKSVLVVPMENMDGEITGVVQLINREGRRGQIAIFGQVEE